MSDPDPTCAHCGRTLGTALRRRRLCWRCRLDPAVRAAHPPAPSPHLRRGVPDFEGPAAPPPRPCAAPPGTAARVEELAARAALGRDLWHRGDATWDTAAAGHAPPDPAARRGNRPCKARRHCLGAGCPWPAERRGLCVTHWRPLSSAVRLGRTTWRALERLGRCLPRAIRACRVAGGQECRRRRRRETDRP